MNSKTYTSNKRTYATMVALVTAFSLAIANPSEAKDYRYKNGYVQKVRYIPGTTKTKIESGLIAQMRKDRQAKPAKSKKSNNKTKTSVAQAKKTTKQAQKKPTQKKQIMVAQAIKQDFYDYER